MKKRFGIIPELFFMGMGMFWTIESYFALGSVNYFALLVTWLLFLQIFYKNRLAGLIYGTALGSFSVYMLLAVTSEYHELEAASIAMRSTALGVVLFSAAILMGIAMVYKYVRTKVNYDESVLTVTY
ncbi:hypothetical protein [Flavobacterium cerinum]|uniref:Uncharacterized protein n=1 Tax=Flavobacterium cerinum TaxID=2502784 RepID=A0A444HBD0_9FLAO|nr:hypothetical protein [Flavobacterium cerinum]RWX00782.1 hypothetical protein EPI11_07105 [Flavobacterium cerinum]